LTEEASTTLTLILTDLLGLAYQRKEPDASPSPPRNVSRHEDPTWRESLITDKSLISRLGKERGNYTAAHSATDKAKKLAARGLDLDGRRRAAALSVSNSQVDTLILNLES